MLLYFKFLEFIRLIRKVLLIGYDPAALWRHQATPFTLPTSLVTAPADIEQEDPDQYMRWPTDIHMGKEIYWENIFTLNLPWARENIDETVPYPDLEYVNFVGPSTGLFYELLIKSFIKIYTKMYSTIQLKLSTMIINLIEEIQVSQECYDIDRLIKFLYYYYNYGKVWKHWSKVCTYIHIYGRLFNDIWNHTRRSISSK